ncbi:e16 [Lactococcus phage bIL170]|uniref:E16 n=3 Tax=Skunavirus TaxID=1623305 RepID=O80144_9CAUD|nr:e16 [Lactococcus phage bIL170]AAC27222.1 e16 [Lactococcus phage bIL170]
MINDKNFLLDGLEFFCYNKYIKLRKRETTMSENIRTAKLLLAEFKNDLTREQYESYQLMIEALEELRKIEKTDK